MIYQTPLFKLICVMISVIVLLTNITHAQAPEGKAYTIQADDWLSKVAEKEYGDPLAYQAIMEATNAKAIEDDSFTAITDPNIIEVGQKLWLPIDVALIPDVTTAVEPLTETLTEPIPTDRLTLSQLKNGSYSGIYEEIVTLTDGLYEGEPFVEGGASRPTVHLIDELLVHGDLDGDGIEDVAMLLNEHSGGSGTFTFMGVQGNQNGEPVDMGTTWIGDRIQVKSMVIENGQIIITIVTQGPTDSQCCPTLIMKTTYALQNGELALVSSEEIGSISLTELDNSSWLLTNFNVDQEPVLSETEIILSFADGKISGSSGCNFYNTNVNSEKGQTLTIDPAISTRMACSETIMAQEFTYLARLQQVTQWRYGAGQLALTYQMEDGAVGTLMYTPESRPEISKSATNLIPTMQLNLTATEVITYIPTEIPTETLSGSCWTNAIGLGRANAYRCTTEDNAIYDPCFVVGDQPTVICNSNPATGDTGFVLTLTEPLPTPDVGDVTKPWIIELSDGLQCGLLTGTIVGVGERTASYGCTDQTYLFDDFQQQGDVWLAEKAVIDINDEGYFIENSEIVPLIRVWQ